VSPCFPLLAAALIRMQIKAAASSGKQGGTPDQWFMTSDTCQSQAQQSGI